MDVGVALATITIISSIIAAKAPPKSKNLIDISLGDCQ